MPKLLVGIAEDTTIAVVVSVPFRTKIEKHKSKMEKQILDEAQIELFVIMLIIMLLQLL